MRQKKGFVLRDVCGEKVIVGEGLETVDFGKLISLNESAALLWEREQSQPKLLIFDWHPVGRNPSDLLLNYLQKLAQKCRGWIIRQDL